MNKEFICPACNKEHNNTTANTKWEEKERYKLQGFILVTILYIFDYIICYNYVTIIYLCNTCGQKRTNKE